MLDMLDIQDSYQAREIIREGKYCGYTTGVANRYVQGNVVILPAEYAIEFAAFCQRNPKPCPLIGMSTPGDPFLNCTLGELDIRTDVPKYRVFRHGELVDEPTNIDSYWRSDLVVFVLGCSLSFELPLLEAGFHLPHIKRGTIVPMYITNQQCRPAGRFWGSMVVSMRSFPKDRVDEVVRITSKFPSVHGGPVHVGDPNDIGIKNLYQPNWGETPDILPADHVPMFWACGVTPQVVIQKAKPSLCITHSPGCMLITDLLNKDLAVS
jgi:uncharacterized protein YcsI (UPF0317 family)